jgi:hypothetical protein
MSRLQTRRRDLRELIRQSAQAAMAAVPGAAPYLAVGWNGNYWQPLAQA